MRISYRLKDSQGLNTKDMEPQLDNLFHVNVGASSNRTNDITYPHSLHISHDDGESLTRVSSDQLDNIDNEFKNLQHFMAQQYPDSEAIPLNVGSKRMVQIDKIGVDLLCCLAHTIDTNIMPIKSCVKVLGYSQPPIQVNHSIPMPTSLPSVPTFKSYIMTTSIQNVNPIHVSHGGNPINKYSYIPPSMSLPFVSQQSPIPTYHITPPYSKPPPTYNNVTTP